MRHILILLIGSLLTIDGFSQIKPSFFPEDVHLVGEQDLKCYCKPGVVNKFRSKGLSLNYGINTGGGYEAAGNSLFMDTPSSLDRLNHLEFKIKIPILIKDRTRVLLGYQYYSEFYQFDRIGLDYEAAFQNLDNNNLKKNSYGLIISHSLDEDNYLGFRYNYSSNGNYDGWMDFAGKYAIHKLVGIYGFKKTDDFEWGIGLIISKSFRRTSALPFLLYNKNFSPKWGIESVFPANVFLRHNIDPSTIAAVGLEYGSQSFRLSVDDIIPQDYAFNHSELSLVWSIERHLTSWVWANIKLGLQRNFSSDFESKIADTASFFAEPKNGVMFQFGFFISPDL